MNLFDMTLEQLEEELKNYISLNQKEMELFKSGKDFIDKAFDRNYYGLEQAQWAIWIYAIYKLKQNDIK